MSWMWIGGYVLVLGGIIVLWPDRKRRKGAKALTAAHGMSRLEI
ncbi:MAG: hypothetical protein IEMM0003_0760 [bacterium]|nr:MAG: hypothetical protein IEMM0003_0760 [bacterium]